MTMQAILDDTYKYLKNPKTLCIEGILGSDFIISSNGFFNRKLTANKMMDTLTDLQSLIMYVIVFIPKSWFY